MSVPIWPHSISPLIPMVSHPLPRMQWALVSAKRLECGSLLPPCSYVQTPCLSPYRHPRGSSTEFGNRPFEPGTICGPRRKPGTTPEQRACHFIRLTAYRRGFGSRGLGCTGCTERPIAVRVPRLRGKLKALTLTVVRQRFAPTSAHCIRSSA